MRFNTLADRMLYFRGLTDYKLMPRSYVMVMVDGRSFSTMIKNKFEKPFDDDFIEMMNETAVYLCENISGCKFAYTQSDEISLVITDFDEQNTESFFGYRLTKMLSIIASLATAKFNQLMMNYRVGEVVDSSASAGDTVQMCRDTINNMPLYQFDCKCWNVPCYEDVFAWFLYRQIDCIRNSKQQAARAYLPHKQLMNLNSDQQIQRLKNEKGIDWNEYDDGKKFGRFIYKETIEHINTGTNERYYRNHWLSHDGFRLTSDENYNGREKFDELNIIPRR